MTRINWDVDGTRFYEAGVDRGVVYVGSQPGVSWTGLKAVTKNPSGGEVKSYYVDGVKFMQSSSAEDFDITLEAYTYPDVFEVCDGTVQTKPGLFLTQQRKQSFGLCYRTKVGNDQTNDYGYKLHIIYNAMASPTTRRHKTHNETPDTIDFMWKVTSTPSSMTGYRRTGHVVIDSRYTNPGVLSLIEDVLYGTVSNAPRLPGLVELTALFDSVVTLTVVDNGDGTFTATLPDTAFKMLDDTTFEITWPTAVFIDDVSYTLSS